MEWGLITYAVPDEELQADLDRLTTRLAEGPTAPFTQTDNALQRRHARPFATALTLERSSQVRLFDTADFAEGTAAFRAKRALRFSGN